MAVNHYRNFKEPLYVYILTSYDIIFKYTCLFLISQNFVEQLLEHRCIVLCGQQGLGKSYLAAKLAEHVVQR